MKVCKSRVNFLTFNGDCWKRFAQAVVTKLNIGSGSGREHLKAPKKS